MSKMTIDQNEEKLLTYEVSDEALEIAGGKEIAGNFTLGPVQACLNAPVDQLG